MMLWFLLKDEPNLNGWQSGLITYGGREEAVVRGLQADGGSARQPAGVREQLAVQRVDVVDEPLDAVARDDALAAGPAHRVRAAPGRGPGARARSASASTSPTATRKPSLPSLDDVGDAADARRDHGSSGGERLDRDHRRSLVRRRAAGARRRTRSTGRRRAGSRRRARRGRCRARARQLLDRVAVGAVADQAERGVDAALAERARTRRGRRGPA